MESLHRELFIVVPLQVFVAEMIILLVLLLFTQYYFFSLVRNHGIVQFFVFSDAKEKPNATALKKKNSSLEKASPTRGAAGD